MTCRFTLLMIGFLSSEYFRYCAAKPIVKNLAKSCSLGPYHVDQSTYFLSSGFNPGHAVDHAIDSKYYVCTCPGGEFCQDPDAWLRLDLEYSQNVFAGRVWNRADPNLDSNFSSIMDGFSVWVGDSDITYNSTGNSKCYTSQTFEHLVTPYFHTFLCESSGRYVFFQPTVIFAPNTNPAINFAEIQLYPTLNNLAHACIDGACPVTQSSYLSSPSCSAVHANDDDMATFVCTCPGGASACSDLDPWVRIDLQQSLPIIAGTVTDRHLGVPSRMVRKYTCIQKRTSSVSPFFCYSLPFFFLLSSFLNIFPSAITYVHLCGRACVLCSCAGRMRYRALVY